MKAGSIVEEIVGVPICKELKLQINDLYLFYRKNKYIFVNKIQEIGRGQRVPSLLLFLPIIFKEIEREDKVAESEDV